MGEVKQSPVNGKFYEKSDQGWVEVPSPGRAGKEQLARGAASFAGSVLDAGQWVGRKVDSGIQGLLGTVGLEGNPLPPQTGPSYQERFVNALGIGPPQTFLQKVGERVGSSLPMTLASGGTASAGQALNAIRTNLIQDIAGSAASQYAEDKGAGPVGQAVAGIIAAIAVPTRLPKAMSRAGSVASDVAESAGESATASARPAMSPATRRLSDSQAAEIAKQYKVKPDNVRAVARYLQDRISIDPVTGEHKIDDFVNTLDDAERILGGKVKPLLGNAVGDVGGPNMIAIQKSVIDENPLASARATGVRDAIVKDLNERMDSLVPYQPTQRSVDNFSSTRQALSAAKSDAWSVVPFDELPKVPATPIKSVLENLRTKKALIYSKLPSDTRRFIENMGDEVTYEDLQELKSDLGEIIADASGIQSSRSTRMSAEGARRIMGTVKSALAEMPETGSDAYTKAVAATKEYYDLFSPDAKTVQAFSRFEDREQIVRKILSSDKPEKEVDNIRRIFGRTQGGMDSVESVFTRDLIGENLGDKPVSTVLKELSKEGKGKFYKALLGEEKYNAIRDIMVGYRIGTAYDVGSATTAIKTGSRFPQLRRLAAEIIHPTKWPESIAKRLDEKSVAERKQLIEELVFDPTGLGKRLAKLPLEGAKQADVDAWVRDFDVLAARARARQVLRSSPMAQQGPRRLEAAVRSAASNAVVNRQSMNGQQVIQPLPAFGEGGVR